MIHPRRLALVLVALAITACVLSEKRTSFRLTDGEWLLYSYPGDASSCFPAGVPGHPNADLYVTVTGTALTLNSFYGLVLPTVPLGSHLYGESYDFGFFATTSGQLAISTACTLSFDNRIEGYGYRDGEAAVTLSVEIGGTGCGAFVGTTIDDIPFPNLSGSSAGTCSASLRGLLYRQPPYPY